MHEIKVKLKNPKINQLHGHDHDGTYIWLQPYRDMAHEHMNYEPAKVLSSKAMLP